MALSKSWAVTRRLPAPFSPLDGRLAAHEGLEEPTYARSKLDDFAWKTRSERSMATRAAVCTASPLRDTSGAKVVFHNNACKISRRSSSFGACYESREYSCDHKRETHFKHDLVLEARQNTRRNPRCIGGSGKNENRESRHLPRPRGLCDTLPESIGYGGLWSFILSI